MTGSQTVKLLVWSGLTMSCMTPVFGQPPGRHRGPMGPRPFPQRGPVIVNNYQNDNSGLVASALGFGAGMLIGKAVAEPPIPRTSTVIVTQPVAPPVIVTQPVSHPPLIVNQAAPSITTVVAQPTPVDAVSEGLKMLNSHWPGKRRDGAMLLGRHRARQGVGPLLDLLRNDRSEDVRKSAAWALAEIGDTNALDYLTKAAQYDHSPEVKAAANAAYQRLVEKVAIVLPDDATFPANRQINSSSGRTNSPPPKPPVPGRSTPISRRSETGTKAVSVNNTPATTTSPFLSQELLPPTNPDLPPALVPPNSP